MHLAGLSVFVREVLPVLTTGPFWQICVLVILSLLLCVHVVRRWTTKGDDMPVSLSTPSISAIVPFVRSRYDFLNRGFQSTGETVFRFRLFGVRHSPRTFFSPFLTHLFHRNQWWRFPAKAAGRRF